MTGLSLTNEDLAVLAIALVAALVAPLILVLAHEHRERAERNDRAKREQERQEKAEERQEKAEKTAQQRHERQLSAIDVVRDIALRVAQELGRLDGHEIRILELEATAEQLKKLPEQYRDHERRISGLETHPAIHRPAGK